jgi:signal transduction histidine kinase
VIKKHGGFIDAESAAGKGTTFIVSLPSCAAGEGGRRDETASFGPLMKGIP